VQPYDNQSPSSYSELSEEHDRSPHETGAPNWSLRDQESFGDDVANDDDDRRNALKSGSNATSNEDDDAEVRNILGRMRAGEIGMDPSAPTLQHADGDGAGDFLSPDDFEDQTAASQSATFEPIDEAAGESDVREEAGNAGLSETEDTRVPSHAEHVEQGGNGEDIIEDAPVVGQVAAVPAHDPQEDEKLVDALDEIRDRYQQWKLRHSGPEALKTGLVLPLLSALGYDVFDPDQVEPIAGASGEHLGYKVQDEEQPRFSLITSPAERQKDVIGNISVVLEKDQFRFDGWVENAEGGSWETAFSLDLSSRGLVSGIALLARETFNPAGFLQLASESANVDDLMQALRSELAEPSQQFVSAIRDQIQASGQRVPALLDQRLAQVCRDLLNLADSAPAPQEDEEDENAERAMTGDETRGLEIVRDICEPFIARSRIVPRPNKVYCAILLDDNNRRTIARLHFSSASVKNLGTFVGRTESKSKIGGSDEIREFAEKILERARELDPGAFSS